MKLPEIEEERILIKVLSCRNYNLDLSSDAIKFPHDSFENRGSLP